MTDSFVSSLFLGELRTDLLLPYPTLDAERAEFLAMLRDVLSRFAADQIDSEAIDKGHAIPAEVMEGLAELGLFGLSIPEAYGGLELNNTPYVRVCEDLAVHDGAVATMSGGHSTIGIKALQLYGTDEQKARYLPRLATGELKAAFALSEPEAGSDAQSLKSTATRAPDGGWILNGNKLWITNGGIADVFTVFARTPDDPREDGRPSISCFLVERGPGLIVGAEEDKLGIRGSSTVPLTFENLAIPAANLIGPVGDGFKLALHVLNAGRTGLAGNCLGASRFLLGEAARYTAERQQFGAPIRSFELIQEKLARMAQDVHALDCMVYLTTGMVDERRGGDVALEAALCKVFGTETLWATVNDAVQCAGGNGFTTDYPYERMLRDARVNMIFEGTNEILRLMVARGGLREPARRLAGGAPSKQDHYGRRALGAEAPDPLDVPAPLQTDAVALSMGVADLATDAAWALGTHGKALGSHQLTLARLADQASSLYGQSAVLARAITAVESRGEEGAADELLLAAGAARRLARRARASHAHLHDNDDDMIRSVAAAVSAAEGLPGAVSGRA